MTLRLQSGLMDCIVNSGNDSAEMICATFPASSGVPGPGSIDFCQRRGPL